MFSAHVLPPKTWTFCATVRCHIHLLMHRMLSEAKAAERLMSMSQSSEVTRDMLIKAE